MSWLRALQRRDVQDPGARSLRRRLGPSRSIADRKAASVLPEPVGAQDQRVLAGGDRRPAQLLGARGLGERAPKPLGDRGGEARDGILTVGGHRQLAMLPMRWPVREPTADTLPG